MHHPSGLPIFPSHLYKRVCLYILLMLLSACDSPTTSSAHPQPTSLKSNKALMTLNLQYKVDQLLWSPDGQYLAVLLSTSTDQLDAPDTLEVWNTHNWQMMWKNTAPSQSWGFWSLVWSPDSKFLAGSQDTDTLQVWDARSGHAIWMYKAFLVSPPDIVWSPDGKRLAVDFDSKGGIGPDIGLRVFDALSGKSLAFNPKLARQVSMSWSPDSTSITTFDQFDPHYSLVVWNITAGSITPIASGDPEGLVAWSPDGKHLAYRAGSSHQILDITTRKPLCTFQINGPGLFLSWSADSLRLFVPGYRGDTGAEVQAWNATNCSTLFMVKEQQDTDEYLAKIGIKGYLSELLAPDVIHVASVYPDNSVHVLDAINKITLHIFIGHAQQVWSLDWSPDSTLLATASADGTVRIWKAL